MAGEHLHTIEKGNLMRQLSLNLFVFRQRLVVRKILKLL